MDKEKKISDAELMRRVKTGDLAAFEILIKRYQDKLVNWAYRFVGNEDDAKEIVQDAFIRAYEKADYFMEDGNFVGWIYKIVGNLAINKIKKKKLEAMHFSINDDIENLDGSLQKFEIEDKSLMPDRIFDNMHFLEVVEKGIEELSPSYREAFILRNVDDLSYEEIAERLNIPVGTVKSRINRARQQLKEYVDKNL